jgi:SNF2 family DNA or RNA helicase
LRFQWRFIGDAYFIIHKAVPTIQESLIVAKFTKPLHEKTRPFQKKAVEFLLARGKRAILSLPPGCGKSMIAVSWLNQLTIQRPMLVISPAGLKEHWRRELLQWAGIESHIISGETTYALPEYPVYIINYEILSKWLTSLPKISGFICDECHLIKEDSTQRTKAVKHLAKRNIYEVFLSATPIKSRPSEFWTVLHMVAPTLFQLKGAYLNRYCDPKLGYRGVVEYKGATNTKELHELVTPYMLRMEKSEILPDLPKKNRIVYEVAISEKECDYYGDQDAIYDLLDKGAKKHQIDDALQKLSRSAYYGKRQTILNKIDEYLEGVDEKIVVVAYHHAVLDDLIEEYGKMACVIDGRVPTQKRQNIVDEFNNGKKRIMIAQIQAGGVGFSMTAAHTMIFAELCYIPGDVIQMEDRIHRMTSTGERVDYIFFVGAATIEEDMLYALDKKTEMISAVLDGKEDMQYFDEKDFYNSLKRRKQSGNSNKGKTGRKA